MKALPDPFEQVVEAMADRLINYGGWRGDRLSAQRAMTQVLRTAQATGLLKLVEERPESDWTEDDPGAPFPPHPEGEPSEKPGKGLRCPRCYGAVRVVFDDEGRGRLEQRPDIGIPNARDVERATELAREIPDPAIDHPQDREAK